MLRQCSGQKCEKPQEQTVELSLFQREMQIVDKYEGKCIAIEYQGELIKGAVVEIRHNKQTISIDFAGGYFVECPADDFHPLIIERAEAEAYMAEIEDEEGNTIISDELSARIDQLLK